MEKQLSKAAGAALLRAFTVAAKNGADGTLIDMFNLNNRELVTLIEARTPIEAPEVQAVLEVNRLIEEAVEGTPAGDELRHAREKDALRRQPTAA
jgi:hypothetical protein